jgi:hypothetical protein
MTGTPAGSQPARVRCGYLVPPSLLSASFPGSQPAIWWDFELGIWRCDSQDSSLEPKVWQIDSQAQLSRALEWGVLRQSKSA